jgi:menaquinone-dependent protoporphyrinogen oxidase
MSILVVYASKHGSTKGIAERIAETLRRQGHAATLRSVAAVGRLEPYEAVVLGSAVYFGAWMKEATEFARRNRAALDRRPIWLFSSGPLGNAARDDEPQPRELAELQRLLRPRDHRMFCGALDSGALSFAERMAGTVVRAPRGDFRDWHAIDAWAAGIARAVSHLVTETPPA